MAFRTKKEVLLEEWGTLDHNLIGSMVMERCSAPAPPTETWTKLLLPYKVPSCPALPSWEEIRETSLRDGLHARNGLHLVCRIGEMVIESSANPNIVEEAENILFVAEKCPELNIPKVLAVWTVPTSSSSVCYCLMMEFIEGISLDSDRFAELSIKSQDTICAKVSAQIRCLRSLPSEGYYGRVHGQGWLNPPMGLRVATGASRSVSGPYSTYEEFTTAIFRAYELQEAIGNTKPEFPSNYASYSTKLLSIFPDWNPHEPKFTWIDPKLTNLIAQRVAGDNGEEDWKVSLIDWECCGWYPAWVQALQFYKRCGALVRDRTQPPYRSGHYPLVPYREEEITPQMMKGFDPNPDLDRFTKIQEAFWWSF